MGVAELARRVGVSRHTIWEIETGRREAPERTMRLIAQELGLPWEGEESRPPVSDEEHALLAVWRRIPERARSLLGAALDAWTGTREEPASEEPASRAADPQATYSDEIGARREQRQRGDRDRSEPRLLPLVGYVAAKEETATVSFDAPLGDPIPVDEAFGDRGCAFVRVRGESMVAAGYQDGEDVLVERVELGQYRIGDIVIAEANGAKQGEQPVDGWLIKRYAGQGGAARPKRPAGVVVLESVMDREAEPITGKVGREVTIHLRAVKR